MEIFSETLTKFICASVSKDCTRLDTNPMELFKRTSKKFQNIVVKIYNNSQFEKKEQRF
jgi:hypothetical protein